MEPWPAARLLVSGLEQLVIDYRRPLLTNMLSPPLTVGSTVHPGCAQSAPLVQPVGCYGTLHRSRENLVITFKPTTVFVPLSSSHIIQL